MGAHSHHGLARSEPDAPLGYFSEHMEAAMADSREHRGAVQFGGGGGLGDDGDDNDDPGPNWQWQGAYDVLGQQKRQEHGIAARDHQAPGSWKPTHRKGRWVHPDRQYLQDVGQAVQQQFHSVMNLT